jgi:hypothetical protein
MRLGEDRSQFTEWIRGSVEGTAVAESVSAIVWCVNRRLVSTAVIDAPA